MWFNLLCALLILRFWNLFRIFKSFISKGIIEFVVKAFLDRRQWSPIRSVLLVIIDWLVGWLGGNAVFSETALRIFLIFCMKLGDYKGRKLTEPDFRKNFFIWRYSRKSLQISSKSDTLIFFSKTALTTSLVFGLELVLNMTFNLN